MKRKVSIGSIFAAAIIVSISFISVVSYQSVQANENENSSPLFVVRTQRATQKIGEGITSMFLGKDKQLNIFPRQNQNEDMIKKAIDFFTSNPTLLTTLLNKLDKFPYINELLAKYGVNKLDVKKYVRILQNDPSRFTEEINQIQRVVLHDDDPQPLGLSTSNPLACFIMGIFVLVPLTVFLTILSLVFTLRILTCLNINDCGNAIANQIWDQLLQGLTPG